MTVIELGEVTHGPGDERLDPPGSARVDRRAVRRFAIGAVAILCALVLTGSEIPRSHGIRPLWSVSIVESQGTWLTTDSLLVQRTTGNASTIAAYDLATGKVRWQRRFDGQIGYPHLAEPAGLLLVPVDGKVAQLGPGNREVLGPTLFRRTMALSAATGEELWRTGGEPHTVTADSALMIEYTPRGTPARLRMMRFGDHGTVWQHDTPGAQNQFVTMAGTRADKVVTATGKGEITIYSYASGELVASARVPWVTARPEEGYFTDLGSVGDYLVVNRARAEIFDMSVYRMDTMAEAWRAGDTGGYALACGPALCLNDGRGIVAHDLVTGAPRWRQTGVSNAWPVGDNLLLLSNATEEARQLLVDATTGEPVDEAVGSLVWSRRQEQEQQVLLLRSTTSPPDRTSVTRWDVHSGRQYVLGTIAANLGAHCESVPGYLTCTQGDALEVIALP